MSSEFRFSPRKSNILVESDMMLSAQLRTLSVHDSAGLVIWSGQSRIGKTTTARWMKERINQAFDETNPHAFRCRHYQVGRIDDEKKAIRSLFHGTIGNLDEGLYRSLPPEDLAGMLAMALVRKRIELIMVDEAGLLTTDAIRGMVLVRDTAEDRGHRLSIVFIGMDDLPAKIEVVPQVAHRVQEWIAFEPFPPETIFQLLVDLHGPYAEAGRNDPAVTAQIHFLQEHHGGLPGLIVPFVSRILTTGGIPEDEIPTLKHFRAAQLLVARDRQTLKTPNRPKHKSSAGRAPEATQ
jgi:hypothetical protein